MSGRYCGCPKASCWCGLPLPARPVRSADPLVIEGDRVARRLVLSRDTWDRIVELAQEHERRTGEKVWPADLAADLLDLGLARSQQL